MAKRAKKKSEKNSQIQCYFCEDAIAADTGVYRTVSRGDRKGQRVGPLCGECLAHAEQHCVVEQEAK